MILTILIILPTVIILIVHTTFTLLTLLTILPLILFHSISSCPVLHKAKRISGIPLTLTIRTYSRWNGRPGRRSRWVRGRESVTSTVEIGNVVSISRLLPPALTVVYGHSGHIHSFLTGEFWSLIFPMYRMSLTFDPLIWLTVTAAVRPAGAGVWVTGRPSHRNRVVRG